MKAEAPETDRSVFGRSAPSWTYSSYRFPNGNAVLALVTGFISMVFVSTPGGLLLLPGLVLMATALWSGRRGIHRARLEPKAGGVGAARVGIALALAGPLLLALWVVLDVW